MSKESGGSAFPYFRRLESPSHEYTAVTVSGMTLRDYFAAKALGGIVSGGTQGDSIESLAHISYLLADAMIKERGNRPA